MQSRAYRLYYSTKEIIRGGAPSLFRQGLVSIASIILNNISADVSDATVAAMSVVKNYYVC